MIATTDQNNFQTAAKEAANKHNKYLLGFVLLLVTASVALGIVAHNLRHHTMDYGILSSLVTYFANHVKGTFQAIWVASFADSLFDDIARSKHDKIFEGQRQLNIDTVISKRNPIMFSSLGMMGATSWEIDSIKRNVGGVLDVQDIICYGIGFGFYTLAMKWIQHNAYKKHIEPFKKQYNLA